MAKLLFSLKILHTKQLHWEQRKSNFVNSNNLRNLRKQLIRINYIVHTYVRNCKPISCSDTSQQVYRTIESCRIKNVLDCVMEMTCGCRLNFTLWSLRLSAPCRRLRNYAICVCAATMHKVALLADEPVATVNLHLDQDAIGLSLSKVDNERRFSASFRTMAKRDRSITFYNAPMRAMCIDNILFLSSCFLQGAGLHASPETLSQENYVRTYRRVILRLHCTEIEFAESSRQRRICRSVNASRYPC